LADGRTIITCFGKGKLIYLLRGKSSSYGIAAERNKTVRLDFSKTARLDFGSAEKNYFLQLTLKIKFGGINFSGSEKNLNWRGEILASSWSIFLMGQTDDKPGQE